MLVCAAPLIGGDGQVQLVALGSALTGTIHAVDRLVLVCAARLVGAGSARCPWHCQDLKSPVVHRQEGCAIYT